MTKNEALALLAQTDRELTPEERLQITEALQQPEYEEDDDWNSSGCSDNEYWNDSGCTGF